KTQKILLQVQAASSPSVSIAKTFNTLPTLTSHVSPPLFKKMLNGNNTTYPAVELLNGMTQDANLYLQNDRFLIFFNNTNYTTPFTAPKEGFIWAAVGQESGDSFESVYVMISNSFGTPIQYYKLVLNP
ncbi:MAG: hypothetical protein JNK65_08495, partial [Deltaproteobacteria bacterium]|nr:hypothetical protein [Deltaproteobacteria bacterium]